MQLEKIDLSFLCGTKTYKDFLSTHKLLLSNISNSQSSNKNNIETSDLESSNALFDIGPKVFRITIDKSPSPAFYLKGVAVNNEGYLVTSANSNGPTIVLADLRKELTGQYVDKSNFILDYEAKHIYKYTDYSQVLPSSSSKLAANGITFNNLDGYSIFKSLVDAKVQSPTNFLNNTINYKYTENSSSIFIKKFAWLIAMSSTFLKPEESEDTKNLSKFPLNVPTVKISDSNSDNFTNSDSSSLGVILSKYTLLTVWLSHIMNAGQLNEKANISDMYINSEDCTNYSEPLQYTIPVSPFQISQFENRYPVEGLYLSSNPDLLNSLKALNMSSDCLALFYDLYRNNLSSSLDQVSIDKFLKQYSIATSNKQTPKNFMTKYKGNTLDARILSYSPLIKRDSIDKYADSLALDDSSKKALFSAYSALGNLFNKEVLFCGSYDYNEFSSSNVDKSEFIPLSASSLNDWGYSFTNNTEDNLIKNGTFGIATKYAKNTNAFGDYRNAFLSFLSSKSNKGLTDKLYNVACINTILDAQRSLGFTNSQLDVYFNSLNTSVFNKDGEYVTLQGKFSISKAVNELINEKYGKNAIYFTNIKDFVNPLSIKTTDLNVDASGDLDESTPFFTVESEQDTAGIASTYLKVISESSEVTNFVDGSLFLGTSLYLKNLGSGYKNLFTENLFAVNNTKDVNKYISNFNDALILSFKNYMLSFYKYIFEYLSVFYGVFSDYPDLLDMLDNKIKELGFDDVVVSKLTKTYKNLTIAISELDINDTQAVNKYLELSNWVFSDLLHAINATINSVSNGAIVIDENKAKLLYMALSSMKQSSRLNSVIENIYNNYSNLSKELAGISNPDALKKYISSLYDNSLVTENAIKEVKSTLSSLDINDVDLINTDGSTHISDLDTDKNLGLTTQLFSAFNKLNKNDSKPEYVLDNIISNTYSDLSSLNTQPPFKTPLNSKEDNWQSDLVDFKSPNANLNWGAASPGSSLIQNIKELTSDKNAIDRLLTAFSNRISNILSSSGTADLLEAVSSRKLKSYADKLKGQFSSADETDWDLSSLQADLDAWDSSIYGEEGDVDSEIISFIPANRLKYLSRFLLKADLSRILDLNKKLILAIREFVMFAFSSHSINGDPTEFLQALAKSFSFNQGLAKSVNPIRTKAFCMAFINVVSLHKELSRDNSEEDLGTKAIQGLYFILLLNLIYKALLYYRGKIYYNIAQSEGGAYIPPIKGKTREVVSDIYKLYTKYFNATDGSVLISADEILDLTSSEESLGICTIDYEYIHDKFQQSLRILSSFVGGILDDLKFIESKK